MSAVNSRSDKISPRQQYFVILCYWLSTFAEGSSRIIIPLYFASIGISVVNIAFMFFWFEAFGLFANFFSGFFINRYGYRRSILISLAFHTIASTLYLLISAQSDYWFLIVLTNISRSFRGVGKELIKTTSSAYMRFSKKSDRSSLIQILLGGQETVKGVGVLLGGYFLTYLGFFSTFAFMAFITFSAFMIAFLKISDRYENNKIDLQGFANVRPEMKFLAWSHTFLYAGRDIWLVVALPIYGQSIDLRPEHISVILAAGLVVFGFIQPFFAKLMRVSPIKLRHRTAAYIFPFLTALVPLSALFVELNFTSLLLIVVLYNFLSGISTVPQNHLHIKFAKKNRASVDIAYYKTISQIGKTVSVLASGYLYHHYSLRGCLMASIASLFIAAVIGFKIRKKSKI